MQRMFMNKRRMAAMGCEFNWWMQHTKDCASKRSVANEAEATDLLHGKPESSDVGTLAKRRFAPANRAAV
jgi:hypothetical protein